MPRTSSSAATVMEGNGASAHSIPSGSRTDAEGERTAITVKAGNASM